MKWAFFFLIISPFVSFGQLNCTIKLIDDYSNEEIDVSPNLHLRKGQFKIDSAQNSIHLEKLRGNYLVISSQEYKTHSEKVKRKKLKNDTVTIRLVPNDSLSMMTFEEIWVKHQRKSDTLEISSANEISRYVKSILNYLLANDGNCGNGLCSYSNTYVFVFYFEMKNGIYKFQEVEKTQPNDYQCLYLEDNLKLLGEVLPPFRISIEPDSPNEKMRFRVMMTYY